MQLRYIRPFGQYKPGDVVGVPDGAAFSDYHLERVAPVPDDASHSAEPGASAEVLDDASRPAAVPVRAPATPVTVPAPAPAAVPKEM